MAAKLIDSYTSPFDDAPSPSVTTLIWFVLRSAKAIPVAWGTKAIGTFIGMVFAVFFDCLFRHQPNIEIGR